MNIKSLNTLITSLKTHKTYKVIHMIQDNNNKGPMKLNYFFILGPKNIGE